MRIRRTKPTPAPIDRDGDRAAIADAWDYGWRVGRSDGKRQMIDHAHPRSKNPYRDTTESEH